MANTRVKVPRTVLIGRIQETIDRVTKEHEEAVAKYEKEVEEFFSKLPDAVEARMKQIAALKDDERQEFVSDVRSYREAISLGGIKIKAPQLEEPRYPTYTQRGYQYNYAFKSYVEALEKSKRVLEAATEDLISVSANDEYANYL